MPRGREASPDPSEPFKWIWHHLKKDWPVLVKQAPLGSFCLFAAGAFLSWLVAMKGVLVHKDAVIEQKDSIIESRDNKITVLERKLSDATETIDLTKLPIWVDKTAIKRPLATDEDLKQDRVMGKTVFVSYIPVKTTRFEGIGPMVYEVSGKTFQDCDLVGPAIVYLQGKSLVEHCMLQHPSGSRLESFLLLVQDRYTFGAIPFNDCGMLNCNFINVGFAGDADDLETIKKGFEGTD
jgi:hypothetical protein